MEKLHQYTQSENFHLISKSMTATEKNPSFYLSLSVSCAFRIVKFTPLYIYLPHSLSLFLCIHISFILSECVLCLHECVCVHV